MPTPASSEQHSFVIPVFGEPPRLAACIESILNQSCRVSQIVMSTSTPSEYLAKIAAAYQLPLFVNPGRVDIATDWNFAITRAKTSLATIAHQDDLYDESYVEIMLETKERHRDALMLFSDFREHSPDGLRPVNVNVRVKRLLCALAFGGQESLVHAAGKRRLLSLGNPICCPSVMLNLDRLAEFTFSEKFKTNLDWEAWTRMASMPGDFVYVKKVLVSKSIHTQSETSVTIANRIREIEDRLMFEKFWPKSIASALLAIYKIGYLANRVP